MYYISVGCSSGRLLRLLGEIKTGHFFFFFILLFFSVCKFLFMLFCNLK